jgi:secondary thiamine-phosphate synthase enzyme
MTNMQVYFKEFTCSTSERIEMVDITEQVTDFVRECNIESGICLVNSLHSTTAIIVNEHERGLISDVLRKIGEEFPKGVGWLHDRVDDNADAHLASIFLGHSKTFPVKNGRLHRGTWQNIFLLELDGPRTRHITCEVMGEQI